jgi:predicted lipoprotein with Yx(FWY)xxD motif
VKQRYPAVLVLGLGAVLAACGGGSSSNVSTKPKPSKAATTTTAAAPATVKVASSTLGQILVTADGKTLYELDKDTATMTNCAGPPCTTLWPALVVTGTPVAGPGLDATKLTVLNGPNGMQAVYGGHPLFMFSQDTAPGDVKGQGFAGNIWHVISPSGQLVLAAAPAASAPTAPPTSPATTPPTSPPTHPATTAPHGGMGGGYGY